MISLIVATDLNGVIGKDGNMPWGRLPNDLKFFKDKTVGSTVVMGRKTFDSIGKPLPDRMNIVITHNKYASSKQGDLQFMTFDEARRIVGIEKELGEVFIIGGETIYRQFLPYADRIYRTVIEAEFEGDTLFPQLENTQWKATLLDEKEPDEKNKYKCYFYQLDRQPLEFEQEYQFIWA